MCTESSIRVDFEPSGHTMKLIIQIPAYNEEKTIGQTIRALPRKAKGVSTIETLVIDDGSSDRTVEAARDAGATHILRLTSHRGLAPAFVAGLEEALQLGADVIVNTDADNQYCADDVETLVTPILEGKADVVIGDRDIRTSSFMGPIKRALQRLGSWAVSKASGIEVPDVTSGFRAFSRDAAFEINVFNPFTYTLETIIQAGNRNMKVVSVRVRTNPPTRPSRLYGGVGSYVRKSIVTIFRVYTLYRPLKTFFALGTVLFLFGTILGARFVFLLVTEEYTAHIQSLILAAVLLISGFQTMLFGIVADLISVNRRLHEESLIRLRKLTIKDQPRREVKPESRTTPALPRVPPAAPKAASAPSVEPADAKRENAETQWVWLMDDEEGAKDLPKPEPRRRRRRGGSHRVAEPRDRKNHPRLSDFESKE